MNYLKLFEAFSQDEKVERANNIFIDYLLFNSFVKGDISVERNYKFARMWHCPGRPLIQTSTWTLIGILDYVMASPLNMERNFLIFPSRKTATYLLTACGIEAKQAVEIAKNIDKFRGVHRAVKRYIDYLRNTPDKKHLLKE